MNLDDLVYAYIDFKKLVIIYMKISPLPFIVMVDTNLRKALLC